MFFWTLFFATTAVLVSSQLKDNKCEKGVQCKNTISMPLLDNMKASLKADLDVTEMNEYLQIYIEQEIQKGLQTAIGELVKNMVKNETTEAELRIQKHLQARQQCAFFATLSSNQKDKTADEVVVFDVVPLNVGGAYSGTTGKFTCQDDGLYTFSWTTLSSANKDFTSVLTINGTLNIADNVVDNDATTDVMKGSSTVIVKLKKGDKAWLKVYSSEGDYLNARWGPTPSSMFSGFKIN